MEEYRIVSPPFHTKKRSSCHAESIYCLERKVGKSFTNCYL